MWMFLALAACTGSYDGPDPSGDGAAIYGRVIGILGGGTGNVEICVHETDLCTLSESDGDFLLEGLPEDTDIIVTMDKEGHLRTAYQHNTSVDDEWRKTLMTNGLVNLMTNRVDTEQVPGRGHAMFIVWSGPDYDGYDRVEGVQMSIDGEGELFYQAGGGMPNPELTSTSSSGSGGAFNLEPGHYDMTFTAPGLTCEHWFSHAFDPGEPVPITILPDYGSYVDVVCR